MRSHSFQTPTVLFIKARTYSKAMTSLCLLKEVYKMFPLKQQEVTIWFTQVMASSLQFHQKLKGTDYREHGQRVYKSGQNPSQ